MFSSSSTRRAFLSLLSAGAALGAARAAALSAAEDRQTSAASNARPLHTVEIDIAVLGHTNYGNDDGAKGRADKILDLNGFRSFMSGDARGGFYYYEGLVYPAGTIPEPDQDDPDGLVWDFQAEPIGAFFNRGWVIINNKDEHPYVPRPHPHLLSHVDYYLGGVPGPDNLSPPDMIQTVGMENGDPPDDVVLRGVTGGTGRFATARGQVSQRRLGRNTTGIIDLPIPFGIAPPAPNYRLSFELSL